MGDIARNPAQRLRRLLLNTYTYFYSDGYTDSFSTIYSYAESYTHAAFNSAPSSNATLVKE